MPTVFIGSLDQIRADLRAQRFGLSYLVVGEDGLPALAEIISAVRPPIDTKNRAGQLFFSPGSLACSAGLFPGFRCGFVSEHNRLDAITQAELGEYPADMDLHGALGQVQAGRDFAVGHARRDQCEDVLLAAGEGLLYLGRAAAAGGSAAGW